MTSKTEQFTGSTDLVLTLAYDYIYNSVALTKNGTRLSKSSFNQATENTITLNVERLTTDTFIVDYNY